MVYIQFFNDSNLIKNNFEKAPLIILDNYKYNIEIDISNYTIGENIGFLVYGYFQFSFKYQFKTLENIVDLGVFNLIYSNFHYIIIKKDINDDSLLLFIEGSSMIALDIIKYEIDEINPENEIMEITGPKLLYFDFFSFNTYNSYGIYSNKSYFFINSKITDKSDIISTKYNNLSLIFQDKNDISLNRKGFLFFHNENKYFRN